MPDNLTIQISADSSKARADLKLLQAELKNLDRQINAAVKTGDTARAKELATTFGVMKEQATALGQLIEGAAGSVNRFHAAAHPHKFYLVEQSLKNLNGAFMAIGHNIGGAQAAIIGFGVGIGLTKILEQFTELAKQMREIRDLSHETGAKPLVVQGMQELAKEAGQSAESANKFLTGLGSTLARAATKTREIGGSAAAEAEADRAIAATGFATFGDKVVQTMRGGIPVVRDFSDSLAILQVNAERLQKLPIEQQMRVVSQAFLRAEQNAKQLGLSEIQLNEIAKDVFGVPAGDVDKLARAYLNIKAKADALAASERGATAANQQNIDEVAAAQEKLSQQLAESAAKGANASAKARAGTIASFTEFVKTIDATLSNLPAIFERTFTFPRGTLADPTFQPFEPVKQEANTLPPFFQTLGTTISNIWRQTFGVSGFGDPSIPAMPVDALKAQFNTLPDYFIGLTNTLKGIWNNFLKSLPRPEPPQSDSSSFPGSGSSGGGGADTGAGGDTSSSGGVIVMRGLGRGPDDSHGPVVGGPDSGYGPGNRPSAAQLLTPGLSSYQAGKARYIDITKLKFASGGMVHGPGTATSDSIVARLSRGEFVMRAAAVNRWGSGFMSALNGFADGGAVMPSRPIPSFANGGMVGGGTPVHLHLGGHAFALSGSNNVVAALVTEANRQQMRSAGVKPSWFAARPG